jgi:hypothetical protein
VPPSPPGPVCVDQAPNADTASAATNQSPLCAQREDQKIIARFSPLADFRKQLVWTQAVPTGLLVSHDVENQHGDGHEQQYE